MSLEKGAGKGLLTDCACLLHQNWTRTGNCRRTLVECTFDWLSNCRQSIRDYEALHATSQAFIYLAVIRLKLKHIV